MAKPRRISIDRIRELRAQGYSHYDIADKLGCSRNYVSVVCRREGIPTPGKLRSRFPIDKAVELYEEGLTYMEIAKKMGYTKNHVANMLNAQGYWSKKRQEKPKKYDRDLILRLYKQGRSIRYIMIEVGCSQQVISETATKAGISRQFGWNPGITPIEELARLYKELGSFSAVAKVVRRKPSVVAARLRRFGYADKARPYGAA